MKKLMLTLSAVACAFGLCAAEQADVSFTSFEEAGLTDILTSTDVNHEGYWSLVEQATTNLTVTDYLSGEAYKGTRPEHFVGDQNKYLKVQTKLGNELTRTVNNTGAAEAIGAEGLYFDSLVKFTACDEKPGDYADAKLLAYVLSDEETGKTNLYVRAGYLTGAGNAVTVKDYWAGDYAYADEWVRLTIRAIDNISDTASDKVAGFVVFINEKPIAIDEAFGDDASAYGHPSATAAYWKNKLALVPSLIEGSDLNAQKITSVSFDGQGAIDDLVFTHKQPTFAEDGGQLAISWNETGFESITVGGTAVDLAKGKYTYTYEKTDEDEQVELTVALTTGYSLASTPSEGVTITPVNENYLVTISPKASKPTLQLTATFAKTVITGTITRSGGEPEDVSYTCVEDMVAAVATLSSGDVAKFALSEDLTAGSDALDPTLSAFLIDCEGEVEIDLAGKNIIGVSEDESFNDSVIFVNKGTLKLYDSVGGGSVKIATTASEGYLGVLALNDKDEAGAYAVIGKTEGDQGAIFAGAVSAPQGALVITKGKFDYESNTTASEPQPLFTLANAVSKDSTYAVDSAEEPTLWVVTPGAAPETVNVEAPKTISNGSYTVEPNGTVAKGTEVTVTVTPTVTVGSITVNGVEIVPVSDVYATNITANADLTFTVVITELAWPDPKDIPEEAKVSDLVPSCPQDLADANAKKLVTWANEQSIPITAAGTILPEAFLLNCANTEAAIEAAKKDFVIPSITINPDGTVTVAEPTMTVNGTITIKGKVNLSDAEWGDKTGKNFFKAFLGF